MSGKKRKKVHFTISTSSDSSDSSEDDKDERTLYKKKRVKQRARKLMRQKEHVKPQYTALERKLKRIATKGVVTLFNMVSKQKRHVMEESRRKRAKTAQKYAGLRGGIPGKLGKGGEASRDSFMAMLKKGMGGEAVSDAVAMDVEEREDTTCKTEMGSILRFFHWYWSQIERLEG